MKKVILNSIVFLLSSMLIFTACNKKKDPQPADDTAAQTQNGSDDSRASSESDAALDDVNASISGSMTTNGARIASLFPYSLTWDTTTANANTVYLLMMELL